MEAELQRRSMSGHVPMTLANHDNARGSAAVTDPVCGMTVNPATAAGSTSHAGTTFHFCSWHCAHKFRDPEPYTASGAPGAAHTRRMDPAHTDPATPPGDQSRRLGVPLPRSPPRDEPHGEAGRPAHPRRLRRDRLPEPTHHAPAGAPGPDDGPRLPHARRHAEDAEHEHVDGDDDGGNDAPRGNRRAILALPPSW